MITINIPVDKTLILFWTEYLISLNPQISRINFKTLNNPNNRKKIMVVIVLRVVILTDIAHSLNGLHVFIGLIRIDVMKRSGTGRVSIGSSKVNSHLTESYADLISFFNGIIIFEKHLSKINMFYNYKVNYSDHLL